MKTLTSQRNNAFAELCLGMAAAELRHGRVVDAGVIVRRAIYARAAGFYMSYARALRLAYAGGEACRDASGIGRQRAQALRRAIDAYRAARPRAGIPEAVAAVLTDSAAPRYYFRPAQGRRILAAEIRRRLARGGAGAPEVLALALSLHLRP